MIAETLSPAECAAKIRAAANVAALTGAGMSTAAGIPDFRGPKGLYATRKYDPETIFEIGHFDRDPEPFYRFSRDFLALLDTIRPTFTHFFLAALEKAGKLSGLITQNIDGLHRKAGSENVAGLHGGYETASCRRCRRGCSGEELRRRMADGGIPRCPACGGTLKPDVVFFGENVRDMAKAEAWTRGSGLLLVLGSSLQVHPAAWLPECAGGEVVAVNLGPVSLSPGRGRYRVEADLDGYFGKVAAELSDLIPLRTGAPDRGTHP